MTSEEIIAIREKLGKSRKELAQLMEVPYETLCRWENGKRSPSKAYEARLRRLSGETPFQPLKQQWIFLASNLEHVTNVVSQSNRIMFGTVHGFSDPDERLLLATVRLRPDASNLADLREFVCSPESSSGRQRRRIAGFFAAVDSQTRPGYHMQSFMFNSRTFGTDNCVIYSKARDEIHVWKCGSGEEMDSTTDIFCSIPYVIVG